MKTFRMSRHGWDLLYGLDEGGLILQNVSHHGFSLAKDIRVTRIWVDTRYGGHRRDYLLGGLDLPGQPVRELTARSYRQRFSSGRRGMRRRGRHLLDNPSATWNQYDRKFGLEASFTSAQPYLSGTPNEAQIQVAERFLFGDYSKDPPHEPGGVLDATRLFPLLSFHFDRVKSASDPFPAYVRADYRIDVSLDNVDRAGLAALIEAHRTGGRRPATNITTNKAGIFRDKETAPTVFGVLVGSSSNLQHIFAALEKPLPYEVASWGLVSGPSGSHPGVTALDTWDNVHVWPARRGMTLTTDPIATPGAFHAFHCHWRWGAVAGDPSADKDDLPGAGGTQFSGVGWSSAAGGPLVDARSPRQDLQFAITKNDLPEWDRDQNPSRDPFQSLFHSASASARSGRTTPDEISTGDDLVLWLSFEVFRDGQGPWDCTFFPGGFFFAHNADQTPWKVAAVGAYDDAVRPPAKRQWQRLAR